MSDSTSRVTLRDIAKRAGVSVMSVSRALNGQGKLSEAKRAEILKLCQQMGYRTQPHLSAAMRFVRRRGTGRYSGNLGYIQCYPLKDYQNPPPTIYLKEIRERAAELGYGVEVIHAAEPGMDGARMSRILKNRGVRGVIVGPLPSAVGELSLDWDYFAAVAIAFSLRRPDLNRVGSDLARGTSLVCEELQKRGYKRIALISARNYLERSHYFILSGFAGWHTRTNSPGRPLTWIWDQWDGQVFLRWLEKHRPDCLLSDPGSVGLDVLKAADLKVPTEIGFATLSTEFTPFPASGLDQRQREFGRVAVNQLLGLLSTGSFGIPPLPVSTLLEGVWKEGPTTRRQKPRRS